MLMESFLQIIRHAHIKHRFIFIGKDINKIPPALHNNCFIKTPSIKVKKFTDYYDLESGWRAAPAILIPPPSPGQACHPAAKQGICQLLPLPFIKKVFAVYFRQIPCGAAGRDLTAAAGAVFITTFGV